MRTIRLLLLALVAIAVSDAHAAPCDPIACNCSAARSDIDLFNAHGCDFVTSQTTPGMWFPRFYFHPTRWDVPASRGWTTPDRGFLNDACNINRDFAKHWNAAFLIEEGLEPNFQESNIPWHGIVDWRGVVRGGVSNAFHGRFAYRILNNLFPTLPLADYTPSSIFDDREVTTYCGLYGRAGVPLRASVMIHEGWHGWQDKNDYDFHFQGPRGTCTVGGESCDFLYLHDLNDFAIGFLHQFTPDGKKFHSPSQVEEEFLCDVFTTSNSLFVSNFVMEQARIKQLGVNKFLINGPAPGCGVPRPLGD